MEKYTISYIARAIKSNADDTTLSGVIKKYMNDYKIEGTVEQWKIDNYYILRRWSYPTFEEYLDAMVKIHAGGETKTEGENQLVDYYTKCINVKERFPKE